VITTSTTAAATVAAIVFATITAMAPYNTIAYCTTHSNDLNDFKGLKTIFCVGLYGAAAIFSFTEVATVDQKFFAILHQVEED